MKYLSTWRSETLRSFSTNARLSGNFYSAERDVQRNDLTERGQGDGGQGRAIPEHQFALGQAEEREPGQLGC